jgi:hypothetical protein
LLTLAWAESKGKCVTGKGLSSRKLECYYLKKLPRHWVGKVSKYSPHFGTPECTQLPFAGAVAEGYTGPEGRNTAPDQ